MQLGHVMGLLLLLPLQEQNAGDRSGVDPAVTGLPVETSKVGYASDTGEFRGSLDQVSGQMILDSRRPARVQMSVPVKRQPMDDNRPGVRRLSSVTLAAHEFGPLPRAQGAECDGVMAATLRLDGIERPARIPISLVIDGPMLQGQGRFAVNWGDFDAIRPRPGLDTWNDVTIEVLLFAMTD